MRLLHGPFGRDMLDLFHFSIAFPLHEPELVSLLNESRDVGTSYTVDTMQFRPIPSVLLLGVVRFGR